jgi:hypothetical protein
MSYIILLHLVKLLLILIVFELEMQDLIIIYNIHIYYTLIIQKPKVIWKLRSLIVLLIMIIMNTVLLPLFQ